MPDLLIVAPDLDERGSIVRIASDLLEFATASLEDYWVPGRAQIDVVASATDCLEMGLVMLGRGEARTVEQGDRSPSPVTMFALLAQSSGAEAEEAFEAFLSLHDRGAIELGIDAERHESVDQALHRYRELRGDPSRVIALGRRAELATEREQMQSEIVRRVPEVELEGELGEFVSLLEEPNDDMRGVLREGALLALQLRQLLYSMELA